MQFNKSFKNDQHSWESEDEDHALGMSVMRYPKGVPAAREAPDVQSTQNMSRGQLEKLVAKSAKSGQYDLQGSWCQALHCRNALQPQVRKPNTTTQVILSTFDFKFKTFLPVCDCRPCGD